MNRRGLIRIVKPVLVGEVSENENLSDVLGDNCENRHGKTEDIGVSPRRSRANRRISAENGPGKREEGTSFGYYKIEGGDITELNSKQSTEIVRKFSNSEEGDVIENRGNGDDVKAHMQKIEEAIANLKMSLSINHIEATNGIFSVTRSFSRQRKVLSAARQFVQDKVDMLQNK